MINLDEFESIGTHWLGLHMNAENATHFDSIEVEHTPKEIKKFIGNINTIYNIYRVQSYDSIMCG